MQYAKQELTIKCKLKKINKNFRPYFEHMFQIAPRQYFKGVINIEIQKKKLQKFTLIANFS